MKKKNTHTLAPDNSAFPSTFCFSHGVFIVCTPSLSALGGRREGGRGVEPPTKFSKRGLDRTSIKKRGVVGKEGDDLCEGQEVAICT